jgi:hypothetical protein
MADAFESWAILELMGHRRLAGLVSEATIAGGTFLRIDVPEVNGQAAVTQFYSPSAVYAISPCSEDVARAVAANSRPAPVSAFELPARATPNGKHHPDYDEEPY